VHPQPEATVSGILVDHCPGQPHNVCSEQYFQVQYCADPLQRCRAVAPPTTMLPLKTYTYSFFFCRHFVLSFVAVASCFCLASIGTVYEERRRDMTSSRQANGSNQEATIEPIIRFALTR
jgi:hypothetical protein